MLPISEGMRDSLSERQEKQPSLCRPRPARKPLAACGGEISRFIIFAILGGIYSLRLQTHQRPCVPSSMHRGPRARAPVAESDRKGYRRSDTNAQSPLCPGWFPVHRTEFSSWLDTGKRKKLLWRRSLALKGCVRFLNGECPVRRKGESGWLAVHQFQRRQSLAGRNEAFCAPGDGELFAAEELADLSVA